MGERHRLPWSTKRIDLDFFGRQSGCSIYCGVKMILSDIGTLFVCPLFNPRSRRSCASIRNTMLWCPASLASCSAFVPNTDLISRSEPLSNSILTKKNLPICDATRLFDGQSNFRSHHKKPSHRTHYKFAPKA